MAEIRRALALLLWVAFPPALLFCSCTRSCASGVGSVRSRPTWRSGRLGLPEIAPRRHPTALVTSGPYAVIRHPRSAQLTLALLGWALLSNHLVSYLVFLLWLPALWAIVALEERELRDRFGAEWEAYARRVPRLLPRRR